MKKQSIIDIKEIKEMGAKDKWIDKSKLEEALTHVIADIEMGSSLKRAIDKYGINPKLFYECRAEKIEGIDTSWLEKRYAQACVLRADALFEEMIDIADDGSNDTYIDAKTGKRKTDWEVVGRSRLRIDTRKFMLAKSRPEKYGEAQLLKIAGHDGKELKGTIFPIDILNVPSNDSAEETESTQEENESNSGESGSR